MTRYIYWRAQFDTGAAFAGRYKDLKTLEGAAKRTWRRYPQADVHTVEVSFVPFPENFSPPNYGRETLARPNGVTLVTSRP